MPLTFTRVQIDKTFVESSGKRFIDLGSLLATAWRRKYPADLHVEIRSSRGSDSCRDWAQTLTAWHRTVFYGDISRFASVQNQLL